jgi:glycerophosphoryl diester phosphodiesterase
MYMISNMKKTLMAFAAVFCTVACSTTKIASSVSTKDLDKQGHRGSRGLMPENTVPAMLKAIDLGVTTLEMDLAISKDKKVVVSHDPNFNENITTTPEGKTLTKAEAAKLLLYGMPYDNIRQYDVGLKPHPLFPQQQKLAVHKPLLSDLIESSERYAAQKGKTLRYNIEIKSTPAGEGTKHPPVEEFVDLAMAVINQNGIAPRTTLQSFDSRALQVAHRKYPAVSTALLIEDYDKRSLDEQLQQLGFTPAIYSPHFSLVNAGLVKSCHEKGMKVIPWTVNSLKEMKKQVGLGVDGIISDYPNLFTEM